VNTRVSGSPGRADRLRAVLFKSRERFIAFKKKLEDYDVDVSVLDFEENSWMGYDYSEIDLLIYYPSFKYSSNHPLALNDVHDNITFLYEQWPHLKVFPDPGIIRYYNDKYKQFQFLTAKKYPVPETIPLVSVDSIDTAEKKLGYPLVVKNRFGAGGGSVFRAFNRRELKKYYHLSTLNLFNRDCAKHIGKILSERMFYYHLIKAKKMPYPFLSPPLLAQKFIKIDRDLKTVVGNGKVVEAHWRFQADASMWKVNIDGGGTGVWGKVPQAAIDLSVKLAADLNARWLNLDLIMENGKFLITEFSPVWHHYAYKEKPSFEYREDYNIDMPLEVSLDLERIIVESLIAAVRQEKRTPLRSLP
jgi:glutathione synthase/RimK-type ligase-like ATP-grasp enzyme